MDKLENLIIYLDKIAQKNNDEFRYCLDIFPNIRRQRIEYSFRCFETADNHDFVSGFGLTIEECASNAESSVLDALEYWHYKDV